MKDYLGNSKSIYVTLGASNHSEKQRADYDFYATDPTAVEWLLKIERFNKNVLEPACGNGHISNVLQQHGFSVISTDIIKRDYDGQIIEQDFLTWFPTPLNNRDIITNPPYRFAKEFVKHAIDISCDNVKIAMFLKLTFLESKSRRELFENYPPEKIWVSSSRLGCARNGIFKNEPSAAAYAWFVWRKGYKGDTVVKWFN